MGRGATTAIKDAAAETLVRPIAFYEGEFASGTLRLWTGVGPRTWNGQTWIGGGNLVGVGPVTESAGLKADGVAMWLSGVNNDLLTKALNEVKHAKLGKLWFGLLDKDNAVIADPVLLFQGRLDTSVIRRGKRTSTVVITYESHALDSSTRERRYTHEDQQIDHPGDEGFAYLTTLQKKQGVQGTDGRGVPCFTGNVAVQTPAGPQRFDSFPRNETFPVCNRGGVRLARLLVHEHDGVMLELKHRDEAGEPRLVTPEHLFFCEPWGGSWVAAAELFRRQVPFQGEVFNLEIVDPDMALAIDDRSYLLGSGELVHNLKKGDDIPPDGGGGF